MFDGDDNGYDIGDNSGDNNGDDNGDNNGDNESEGKEENNLLTHLAVKGNPVEVHGTRDLHSGKDAFNSLETKKTTTRVYDYYHRYFCYYYLAVMVNSMRRTPLTLFRENLSWKNRRPASFLLLFTC